MGHPYSSFHWGTGLCLFDVVLSCWRDLFKNSRCISKAYSLDFVYLLILERGMFGSKGELEVSTVRVPRWPPFSDAWMLYFISFFPADVHGNKEDPVRCGCQSISSWWSSGNHNQIWWWCWCWCLGCAWLMTDDLWPMTEPDKWCLITVKRQAVWDVAAMS